MRSLGSLALGPVRPHFNLEVARRSRSSQIFIIITTINVNAIINTINIIDINTNTITIILFRSPSLLSSSYSPKREHRLDSVGIMTMDGLGMVGLTIIIVAVCSRRDSHILNIILIYNRHRIEVTGPMEFLKYHHHLYQSETEWFVQFKLIGNCLHPRRL